MNEEQMRKEFEELIVDMLDSHDMPYHLDRDEDDYVYKNTYDLWSGFKLSREAMKPIKFPDEIEIDLIGDQAVNSHSNSYAEGYNDALSDLELKITELGYKVGE